MICISVRILYQIAAASVEKATLHPLFMSHLVLSPWLSVGPNINDGIACLCSNARMFYISVLSDYVIVTDCLKLLLTS